MTSDLVDPLASKEQRLWPALVVIPSGSFLMGAGRDDKFATDTERPARRVTISHAFAIGRTPVTLGEYRQYASAHRDDAPDDFPVVNVSWTDARQYCGWLSERTHQRFRLPSESEWEYACRAGTAEPFNVGGDLPTAAANFLYSEAGERVGVKRRTQVGSYTANAFGVQDMHGNVSEWVEDLWHPNYVGAPGDGSAWVGRRSSHAATFRVIRGGAWDQLPRLLRSSARDRLPADARQDNVGFRVAATLEN